MKRIRICILLLVLGIGVISNGYARLTDEAKKHYGLGMRVSAVKGLALSMWNTAGPFGDTYMGGLGISATGIYNPKIAKSSVDIVTPFTARFGFGQVPMDIGIHIGTIWNYDKKAGIRVPKIFSVNKSKFVGPVLLGLDMRYAFGDDIFGSAIGLVYAFQFRREFRREHQGISVKALHGVKADIDIDIDIDAAVYSHTVGARVQMSSTLFKFLELSFAAEPFINFTKVRASTIVKVNSEALNVSSKNIGKYSYDPKPAYGVNVHVGTSLRLYRFFLDVSAGYEPFSSTTSVSLGMRILL